MEIVYPEWFDELAQFEHESKGFLNGVVVHAKEGLRKPIFHDSIRFLQKIEEDINTQGFFHETDLIIVPCVTKDYIEKAVKALFGEPHPES